MKKSFRITMGIIGIIICGILMIESLKYAVKAGSRELMLGGVIFFAGMVICLIGIIEETRLVERIANLFAGEEDDDE